MKMVILLAFTLKVAIAKNLAASRSIVNASNQAFPALTYAYVKAAKTAKKNPKTKMKHKKLLCKLFKKKSSLRRKRKCH